MSAVGRRWRRAAASASSATRQFGRVDAGEFVGELRRGEAWRRRSGRWRGRPRRGRRLESPLLLRAGWAIGGEEVARARVEQRVVGERAGRDDAGHFALDEPLGLLRVFDLLADGGAVAGGDDLGEVASS